MVDEEQPARLGEAAVLVGDVALGSPGAIPPVFGSWGSRSVGMAPQIRSFHLPFLDLRPSTLGQLMPAGASGCQLYLPSNRLHSQRCYRRSRSFLPRTLLPMRARVSIPE